MELMMVKFVESCRICSPREFAQVCFARFASGRRGQKKKSHPKRIRTKMTFCLDTNSITTAMTDPAPPKISLSFSTKKLGSGTKSTPVNGVKRPAAALFGDYDNNRDDTRHEEITHFDQAAGGAINTAKPAADKGPRIIPYRKHQRGFVPEVPNNEERNYTPPKEDKQIHYGLNVRAKSPEEPVADTNDEEKEPVVEKSLDEQALDALLGNASVDPSRTIPHAISNEEAFRRDYDEAPSVPTEDDYDAVPVEGFGAALLRGMGWKDGQPIGRNKGNAIKEVKPVQRRPALLGVGAKPAAALGIPELGAWGEKENKGKKKDAQSYNPVVLRNKITGEEITEEELKAKLAAQRNDELDLKSNQRRQENSGSRHRSDEKHIKRDRHKNYEDRDDRSGWRDRDKRDDRYASDRKRDRSRDDDRYDSDRRRERPKYDERDDRERQRDRDRDDRDRRKRRWRDGDDDRRERDRKRRDYVDDHYDSDRKRDRDRHSESRRR